MSSFIQQAVIGDLVKDNIALTQRVLQLTNELKERDKELARIKEASLIALNTMADVSNQLFVLKKQIAKPSTSDSYTQTAITTQQYQYQYAVDGINSVWVSCKDDKKDNKR